MLPLQPMLLGADAVAPPIAFRASATTAASATVSKPAGVAVGDLVVVLCGDCTLTNALVTTAGSGWSSSFISWNRSGGVAITSALFWKVLNPTDVANTWGAGEVSAYLAVAYNNPGALSAAVRASSFSTGGVGTVTLAGFVPSGGSKGVVSAAVGGTSGSALTSPAGFTERAETAQNGTCRAEIDDATTAYVGSAETWTFGAAIDLAAWLLELL